MKKYLPNIMNIRLVMIALFAIVCNMSKAQVEDSPLNPWWDSNANGYVLRTIDSEHTVLDAMKALQEINENGSWSDYSSYTFYLTEDVDFSELDGNWTPLGTSDNPFQGYFYCYAPTYDYYSAPTSSLGIYPKNTSDSPAEDKQWEGAYKYTFNVSDIESLFGKTKYTFCVSDIETYIGEHGDELSYSDIDGFISTELESNSILYKRTDDDNLIVVTDNLNSPLSDISYSEESLESYDTYNNDFNEFIYQTLSSYFVEYDESASTLSFSTDEDLSNFTLFSCLEPTSKEDAYYKLLPYPSTSLGYYNDESGNPIYYSTDGHIGTCKIKNMTVDGEYDAAGFFGYVDDDCDFCGFTFENCSVTTNNEDGYAGILYGKCTESAAPDIYDIFIGVNERCSIKADYAGGIYGYNDCQYASVNSTSGISEYTFDPELSTYDPETHEGAYDENGYSINKIYVSIDAGKRGNKISSTDASADYTYVDAEGIETKYAFGTNENGEYGTGEDGNPFIISTKQHLLNLQSILNGINEDSYSNYEDLRELDNLSIGSSSSAMFEGCYFKQTADIDFGEEHLTAGIGIDDTDSDSEAGPFAGTYDGDGHTIKVNIITPDTDDYTYTALFANTYNATIKNLSIEGTTTNNCDYGYAAGIVGNASESLTLENCCIDVEVNAEYGKYGLIGSCSADNVDIQDCFNKAEKVLEWFPGANNYYIEKINNDDPVSLFSWNDGGGTGHPDCPLRISTLNVFYTEKGKEFAEYGLTYELTDNIILQDAKLVDPDGDYVGPDDASNEDYYIEKFCGTLRGKATCCDNSGNEVETGVVISGLTDKALFGTITGDSKIEKIGFVNCYNATNRKVNLATSIADDATLEVEKCYSDGYFDFFTSATVSDSYSYSETPNPPVTNTSLDSGVEDYYSSCMGVTRYILSENCIPIIGIEDENGSSIDVYTDAIATQPSSNEIISSDNPRLQFKYNVAYNGKVRYMKLIDTMDYYELLENQLASPDEEVLKDAYKKFEDGIKATEFTGTDATVDHVYYCRKAHNDWESVTLPFAYELSDLKNSSNFRAYTFSEGNGNNAVFGIANAEIEAGTPMLISVTDATDFVVKKSNPTFVTTPNDGTYFKGALQIVDNVEGKYKIDGTKTADGGGKLLKCTGNSWIYPFRAYLDFGDSAGVKAITFRISDDSATSIDAVELAPSIVATGEVYGLEGRKVSAKGLNGLKPGLYIMNGKKFVVK